MAHWIIEDKGFGGQCYRCSNCRNTWVDIYDNVSSEDFCPACGEYLDRDKTEYIEESKSYKTETSKETCRCLETESCDEYWGKWLECECGYISNTTGAKYCGGCGKKIEVVGVAGKQAHFGEH